MVKLATHDACTGCGACAFKCPKQCISMKEDAIGQIYPLIDSTNCIECYSCEKVCPILNEPTFCQSKKAYAAWSNDKEERRTSASGGIAIEMYKYAISNGWLVVGAVQNKDFSVSHKMVSTYEELAAFKNSKYVFSDAYAVFSEIKSALNFKDNKKVLFIGLPCQVAALRKLFRDNENLLLVEVVCHGTTPVSYLKQHIDMLSSKYGKTAMRMSFRDPDAYTYTFTFTLYDAAGTRFYAGRTKDGDLYQYGYHRMVSYRENCYHCPFARAERLSDLTLSDYKGLGKMGAPVSFGEKEVSCILVHTPKGQMLVDSLVESGAVVAAERPVREPVAGDPQLRHPSRKSRARREFERQIVLAGGDFETAMQHVVAHEEKFRALDFCRTLPRRMAGKVKRALLKRIHREN